MLQKNAGDKDEHELLVFMRGAHRSMGFGREGVWRLLRDEIRPQERGEKLKGLFVRYPKIGRSEGDRAQEMIWTWFFNDLDFVSDGRTRENEIRLVYSPPGAS